MDRFTYDVIERRRDWVSALRSGEYVQASYVLRNPAREDDGKKHMCCLGVACDRYNPKGWGTRRPEVYLATNTGLPPSDVSKAFGLDVIPRHAAVETGDFYSNGIPITAVVVNERGMAPALFADMNDRLGFSFADIADAIEVHLP